MNNMIIGGHDPVRDKPYVYYETIAGGMGARPDKDGISGIQTHMTNTMNTPIEAMEFAFHTTPSALCASSRIRWRRAVQGWGRRGARGRIPGPGPGDFDVGTAPTTTARLPRWPPRRTGGECAVAGRSRRSAAGWQGNHRRGGGGRAQRPHPGSRWMGRHRNTATSIDRHQYIPVRLPKGAILLSTLLISGVLMAGCSSEITADPARPFAGS